MTDIPYDIMKAAWDLVIHEKLVVGPGQKQVNSVKAIARAILSERERCAKVAMECHDEFHTDADLWARDGMWNSSRNSFAQCEAAIIISERINNA